MSGREKRGFKSQPGWSDRIRAHRSVYRFGGTWARTLLAAIPWINALLLALLLYIAHGQLTVAPGVMFDLPSGPLSEGTRTELTALMLPISRDVAGDDETMVFFDDDRYIMTESTQIELLTERIGARVRQRAERTLLLLADRRVAHGEVLRFVRIAREAGVQRVNVAEKPD